MSGVPWFLWEWFEDEAPPRLIEAGRWREVGWEALFHRAFLGDQAAAERLRLTHEHAPFLPSHWRELDGVSKVLAWVRDDPSVCATLATLQIGLSGNAAELFATAASAESVAALHVLAKETDREVESVSPPSFDPKPSLEAELVRADDREMFGWVEQIAESLPKHAHLVTTKHRSEGMPPPGSVWWRTDKSFLIVAEKITYDREIATTGRNPTVDAINRGPYSRSHVYGGVLAIDCRRNFRGHDLGLRAFYNYTAEDELRPGELWR